MINALLAPAARAPAGAGHCRRYRCFFTPYLVHTKDPDATFTYPRSKVKPGDASCPQMPLVDCTLCKGEAPPARGGASSSELPHSASLLQSPTGLAA